MAKEEEADPQHFLNVAKKHLGRIESAWDPPDWGILGTYGLYCLEAAVRAAAIKVGETSIPNHWRKSEQAENLSQRHSLPNISDMLKSLNALRKSEAYGDSEVDESDYDAEDIVRKVKIYFEAVSAFCAR